MLSSYGWSPRRWATIENRTSLLSNQVPTQTEIQSANSSQPKVEPNGMGGNRLQATGQGRLGLGLGLG
jgi:hypothetical protein